MNITAPTEKTSLSDQLQAVTANARAKMPQGTIETSQKATAKLKETGIADRALTVGQSMPEFSLPDASGQTVHSADLLAKGPLLVTFYRGGWCPYCNLELKALQSYLAEFQAKGVTLVAISPELPEKVLSTEEKDGLKFTVLSDGGNRVARQFGLVYRVDDNALEIMQKFGTDLRQNNGDDSLELPLPSTYLVDREGMIRQAFVDADYTHRAEPATILEWIEAL